MQIDLGNLFLKRDAESRSLSAENPLGEKGKGAMADPQGEGPARELGQGWKVRPCLTLKAGETLSLAYRIYIHPGDATDGKVREKYHDFINPPAVSLA